MSRLHDSGNIIIKCLSILLSIFFLSFFPNPPHTHKIKHPHKLHPSDSQSQQAYPAMVEALSIFIHIWWPWQVQEDVIIQHSAEHWDGVGETKDFDMSPPFYNQNSAVAERSGLFTWKVYLLGRILFNGTPLSQGIYFLLSPILYSDILKS